MPDSSTQACLYVASTNLHKVQEMAQILSPAGITVRSVKELGGMPEVIEDGETFQANAIKKAVDAARILNHPVIADDSGLEVFGLNGAPGIYSARYAGEGGNDGRNLAKLLSEMSKKNLKTPAERAARFVCVIAVATPQGLIGTAKGEIRGTIADTPQGNGGFGYDPAFIPEGYQQTFGTLSAEIKNDLSHRGRALQNALTQNLFAPLLGK